MDSNNNTSPTESSSPLRILLVEDSKHDVLAFRRAFSKSQVVSEITHYIRAEEALDRLDVDAMSFDLVVTDHKLPGMSGLELCQQILKRQYPLPMVLLTGAGSEYLTVEALKAGVDDYIIKDPNRGYLELLPVVLPDAVKRFHDRLARQQAEEALRQYAAELEARNEELDAFVHTVAHDLKGPLGYIVGYAEFLEDDYETLPDGELHRCLHTIAQSGRKMANIIDELLLLAGVRKMKRVAIGPLDMASIVAEAQERLVNLIEEHQASLSLPDIWPVALGHAPWVEEVWVNYLSNAIKYGGRPPYVELGADQGANQPTEQPMVCFWVRDNGPGLTLEEQARLFRPFTRLDQARAKGHGLGLSIVRRIVEKLAGQVGVESKGVPGQGSTFWFTLPAIQDD